ncbi:hypothetical protein Tco_0084746 [Tanacetum coccineum]
MAPKTFSSKLRQHHRWLSKKEVDIGLPKLKYVQDATCSSCEALSRHPPSSSGMTETERQSDLQSGKCDHTERFRTSDPPIPTSKTELKPPQIAFSDADHVPVALILQKHSGGIHFSSDKIGFSIGQRIRNEMFDSSRTGGSDK